jgi:hypothetical protein
LAGERAQYSWGEYSTGTRNWRGDGQLRGSQMYRIQLFNVLKTASVVALMYMLITAMLFVALVPLLVFVGFSIGSDPSVRQGLGSLAVVGLFAVFGYGIAAWIATAIGCVIYNAIAAWIGGIEVKVEPVGPPTAPPPWLTPVG